MVSPHETEEQERTIEIAAISTGRSEIDKKLGGGIPVGSLTLIEGQSDAGKSVLTQHVIWGTLTAKKHRAILFTTENTLRSINTQMESLGLDVLDHLLLGSLKVYPIRMSQMELDTAFDTILGVARQNPSYKVLAIDSVTPMIAHVPVENVITYFEGCKTLCDHGWTIVNVAHTYAFNDEVLSRIRSACDAHFRLRIEEIGDKLVKVMEVAKVRGADKVTGNLVSFEVEPGVGMRVMPLSKAKA